MSELDRRTYGATERVLGGSPLGVLVRLLVMSFVVGVILTVLDVDPTDIVHWVEARVREISTLGFGTLEQGLRIMILGAVVVVPVWLLVRVLKIVGR